MHDGSQCRVGTWGVQDEFAGFKDTAEQIAEAKDADLERVLGVNASLRDQITVLQSQSRRVRPPSLSFLPLSAHGWWDRCTEPSSPLLC